MNMEEKIAKINELYHKSKTAEGLTAEEKVLQQELRADYIKSFRENVRAQLNNISIVEEDGTVTDLKDKAKKLN